SSPTTSEWPKGNIVLHNDNNYTSMTTLMPPIIKTAPGADLMVCWDNLMKDLLCHDIVAPSNGIDNVAFLQIKNLSKTQVQDKLAVGQLDENLVNVYREHHVDSATKCANLSQYVLGASVLDPVADYAVPAAGKTVTYMLLFASGTIPGVGSRAMTFIEPTDGDTTMMVEAPDACAGGILDFHATLGAHMSIPAMDSTKWHVDWSQITHDSFQNAVNFPKIDKVLLGFYQGMTADNLKDNFKDIEQIATKLYEVAVPKGARDVQLADAKARGTGEAFAGFTMTDGVWAMAVLCSQCQVPAPVLLTILDPA
ncbi:MAG TPA: hypothetical protein VN903_14235, partial [Polyangia bacterium]|nr:hypothetical protein [Polyangia bacterium]